jgi:hypothetical protein
LVHDNHNHCKFDIVFAFDSFVHPSYEVAFKSNIDVINYEYHVKELVSNIWFLEINEKKWTMLIKEVGE